MNRLLSEKSGQAGFFLLLIIIVIGIGAAHFLGYIDVGEVRNVFDDGNGPIDNNVENSFANINIKNKPENVFYDSEGEVGVEVESNVFNYVYLKSYGMDNEGDVTYEEIEDGILLPPTKSTTNLGYYIKQDNITDSIYFEIKTHKKGESGDLMDEVSFTVSVLDGS